MYFLEEISRLEAHWTRSPSTSPFPCLLRRQRERLGEDRRRRHPQQQKALAICRAGPSGAHNPHYDMQNGTSKACEQEQSCWAWSARGARPACGVGRTPAEPSLAMLPVLTLACRRPAVKSLQVVGLRNQAMVIRLKLEPEVHKAYLAVIVEVRDLPSSVLKEPHAHRALRS